MSREKTPDTPESLPEPATLLERLTGALEALGQRQATAPSDQVTAMLGQLSAALARVSETQLEGSRIIAAETRRAHRPSNEVVPQVSVFNRRGVTLPADATGPRKAPLKCTMMLPWIAEWESLTREEVDLLNLLEPGEFLIRRADQSKVRVIVTLSYHVDGHTPSTLVLTHETAFNNDNFRLAPPLATMLRQILKQSSPAVARAANQVLTDEEEEALIEAGELAIAV